MSVFDQARNTLKNLQSKATPIINTAVHNFQPFGNTQAIQAGFNQVSNAKIPTASVPFVGAQIGQVQRMQNQQPVFTPRQAFNNVVAPVYQQPLRTLAQLQMSQPNSFINSPQVQAGLKTPIGKQIGNLAFGNEPLQSYSQRYKQGYNIPLINRNVSGPASLPLFGAGIALSLAPQTGVEKTGIADLTKLATGAKSVEELKTLLKAKPELNKVAQSLIKDTRHANINKIEDIFNQVKGNLPDLAGKKWSDTMREYNANKILDAQHAKNLEAKINIEAPGLKKDFQTPQKPAYEVPTGVRKLILKGNELINDQRGFIKPGEFLPKGKQGKEQLLKEGQSVSSIKPSQLPEQLGKGLPLEKSSSPNIVPLTEKSTQIGKQVEQKLAPLDRTPQQVQEARALAQTPSEAGSSLGGSGKPPSSLSVQDSSKYNFNINKNRLKITPEQKKTLDTTINAVKPELEKIKGKPLSNNEVIKAAKTSDILTQVTTREQTLQAETAMLNARKRMVELNNNIDRLAKEGNTKEMQTQMKDLIESLKVVSSNAADAGRKLQSLSVDVGDESIRTQVLKDITKTGASTDEILKAAQKVDWNNADSITKFYRQFVKPSVLDVLDEYRYNNMLSSPKTHIRNAFSNALQTFVTRPVTLLVEGKPADASKYFTGAASSFPDAVQAFRDSFAGKTAMAKPDMARISSGKLPKILTIPTRAMEAGDKFFTALIQGGELARGSTPEEAAKIAEYSLFRQGLRPEGQGPVLNAIDSLTNWTYQAPKAVRWFVPFIRTPMNFAKQWIEYSPAGFATAIKAGNPREQIAKALIGSSVTAFGGMLALQGRTTWAAPTDPKEKDAFYATGRKPFSILVGDKWVPMQYAGPFALALALPAAMKYFQEDNRTALTDSQLDKALKVVSSSAQFFSQQTFLTGLGNFVNWASGSPDVSLGSSLGFTAQQIVPMEALISYVNQIIDPVYRKGNGFAESIQKNIPILSQQLPAYTNPDGTPSMRTPSNYIAPYDLGQRQAQYEPALQGRTDQLQTNALFTRDLKDYTTIDGQIKDLVKAGQMEQAKNLYVQNQDILRRGAITKEFQSQFAKLYSDLQDLNSTNSLTPQQKEQVRKAIQARIDLYMKYYANFQKQ